MDALSGMSTAAGELDPNTESSISYSSPCRSDHMADRGAAQSQDEGQGQGQPYTLNLTRQEAVLTETQTFFQLINSSQTTVTRLLYSQSGLRLRCRREG
jgi:hypothetical protein